MMPFTTVSSNEPFPFDAPSNPEATRELIDMMSRLEQILDMTEEILDGDPFWLDPTPIAPQEVLVVDEVPLTQLNESSFFEQEDDCALDCLHSILHKRHRSAAPDLTGSSIQPDAFHRAFKKQTKFDPFFRTKISVSTYQAPKWEERLQELVAYHKKYGDCLVPHNWPENVPLAQWVKRQRYQYKLKREGSRSTLIAERQCALEKLGFTWDSHESAWEERLAELKEFKNIHGHCRVPSTFAEHPKMSVWVKCQRRQYKLFWSGERSNITEERIAKLTNLGFVWNPRNLGR
jgi:hypothetical protein